MGALLWMSHPAWPSFVWQTYDYYFDPTAGYFGSRKGSEPLHVQWNPLSDAVEVVNYSAGEQQGLVAAAELLNLDGSRQWQAEAELDSPEDSVRAPIALLWPETLSPVHFVRLRLSRGGALVSENLYWRGREEGNFRALRTLPQVPLEADHPARAAGRPLRAHDRDREPVGARRRCSSGSRRCAPRAATASGPRCSATTTSR